MKPLCPWGIVLAAISVLGPLLSAAAAPPLSLLFPFRRVEADANKSYELREEHGPWLIVAATFLGESGERQAKQLVLELRKRYKLAAYIYKREFDYGERVTGLGVDQYGRPKQMRYFHNPRFQETAVFVGEFRFVDDPHAQQVLEQIKHAKPETLSATATNPTSQRMALWREIQRRVSPNVEMKDKGPMRSAFITRNPLLPEEYFAPQGPDNLILELNRGLEYSLLDCPRLYSVRVATFRGDSTWNVEQIELAKREVRSGIRDDDSRLAKAAEKAAKLTFALRKRGVEAFQFHDRHESIVTIGAFDSVGQRRRDGKIEIDPTIHQIMKQYGANVQDLPGLPGAMTPCSLDGISFDAQPMPVKVPKPSVVAGFTQSYR